MVEKRAHQRVETILTVHWDGSTTNTEVRVSDLSVGGCFVDTVTEAFKGETVKLQILLPTNEWLELQGVVMHHHPRFGFGLRFVDLNETQQHQISAFLRSQGLSKETEQTTADSPGSYLASGAVELR